MSEQERCFWKDDTKMSDRNPCKDCDGFKKKCPTYIPLNKDMPQFMGLMRQMYKKNNYEDKE